MIRAYSEELTGVGEVRWSRVCGEAWNYQIQGWRDLFPFGEHPPSSRIELRHAQEGGHHAAVAVVPAPEPGTLLAAGALGCVGAAARIRRRRRRKDEPEETQAA